MKKYALTGLALAVSWGATLYALAVFPDRVPAHWNAAGEVDRWGSKFETLLLPALQLLIVALLAAWPRFDPSRRGPWRAWPLIVAATAWVLTLVQLGVLYLTWSTLQGVAPGPVASERGLRVLLVALGLTFALIGNYLPKAPQNWLFGVRTPWTLTSPRAWQVTNRVGGWVFIALGLGVAVAAWWWPPEWVLWGMTAALLLATLYLVVLSWAVWRAEKGAGS
ncbi:SdpI family protein [Oceanithermus sp.]|uniref:SdpI family protein n=1 Tax=Oceanithermus sp. TaxID=2268145 RepID=UPI00257C14B6|nr:SdpI family protein [Oceanithermus sp.]